MNYSPNIFFAVIIVFVDKENPLVNGKDIHNRDTRIVSKYQLADHPKNAWCQETISHHTIIGKFHDLLPEEERSQRGFQV